MIPAPSVESPRGLRCSLQCGAPAFVREWGAFVACGWRGLVAEGVGEEGAATGEGDDSESDAGREEQPGGWLGGDADRVGDGAEDLLRGGIGAALDRKEAGVDALGD
jgi:hypothetical protein